MKHKGKEIDRYYYLDIKKAIDPSADDEEVVISIPATKQVTSDFGRKIEKDLSTRQDEFKQKMFPLNIILNSGEEQGWQNEYYAFYNYDPAVILLDKETPKEAVCQVFENVNTGGVSLRFLLWTILRSVRIGRNARKNISRALC